MPDIHPEVALKLTIPKRWQTRMNQAWHDLKAERPEDARFYTDRAPMQEVPDESKPPIVLPNGKTAQPVRRERKAGIGTIQVWRPGKAKKGALSEVYNGEEWYGVKADVPLGTDYEGCLKAIRELL